jgi:hypothetical protein
VTGNNLCVFPPVPLNSAITLLSQPRLIVDPGYVNVEMSNTLPIDSAQPQLVLLCAEPCVVIEENLERPRYV